MADLDFALRAGVTITLREISQTEFLGLRVLHAERDIYQEEKMKETAMENKPRKWSNVG